MPKNNQKTSSVDYRDLGFVRLGFISPKIHLNNPLKNTTEHIKFFSELASKGVMRAIGPELGLTGYSLGDLLQHEVTQDNVLQALSTLLEDTKNLDMLMTVGAPLQHRGALYNCAITFIHGQILAVNVKIYRPNYREFYESRHFKTGSNLSPDSTITLFGQTVPFTPYVLIESKKYPWLCIHTSICEDDWVTTPIGNYAALAGSTHQDNLSASNITIGKSAYRHSLISHLSSIRCSSMTYSATSGDGESSQDTTWDGDCMIASNGTILASSERFALGGQMNFADVDIKLLETERMRLTSYNENVDEAAKFYRFTRVSFDSTLGKPLNTLVTTIDPLPFVPKDPATLDERCYEVANIQTMALIQRLNSLPPHFRKAYIGVSGGLDSARALQVIVEAFDKLGLPRTDIYAITMPGFGTTSRTYQNALKLIRGLGVTFLELPIRSLALHQLSQSDFKLSADPKTLQPLLENLAQKLQNLDWKDLSGNDITKLLFDNDLAQSILPETPNVAFENAQAWARMMTLFINSAVKGGLVIGTGDLTESLLGWCTLFADHAAHYNLNVGIPKSLIKYLVVWSARKQFIDNKDVKEAFEDIADTPISPELLFARDNEISQKTEDILGPLVLHDFFGYWMVRYGLSPYKTYYLAKVAFPDFTSKTIKDTLLIFITRFFNNQFKRDTVPDGPKVGLLALSPRGDWRMPPDARPDTWLQSHSQIPTE